MDNVITDGYSPVLEGLAGGTNAKVDTNTGAKVILPPTGGITVQVPLTQVNPYVADVTRTDQARLGMIDLNPTARPGSDLGPVAEMYQYGTTGDPANKTRLYGQDVYRTGMKGFNQVMWDVLQRIDPLIEKKLITNPRFWHDRLPRGQYPLFDGAVQQSRIFRGGLQKYAGLSEWEAIDPVPSLANDPCSFPKHDTYNYGWEQLAWSGMRAAWGSDPICANAFRYIKDAAQQLALILDVGIERGIQMQEVFNRDTYISKATDFGRSFVMTSAFHGTTVGANSPRYFYDPFVKFGSAGNRDTKTAVSSLVAGPDDKPKAFCVIDASEEIEPVNFSVLDRVHELLKLRCPDAALGSDSGEPTFGLMINSEDVDNAIEGDDKMYREWLEAKPLALIQKYNLSPRVFRRWAIVSDANQLRFKIKRYIASYTDELCTNYGGVAAALIGKPVYIALAVDPFVADPDHVGINGGPLPIENADYVDAELAIAPVFMNNVLTNLFEAGGVNLGSGTHFGAYPALNGQWSWVLAPRTDQNPFEQIGKFYGLFAIHQKPEPRVRDVMSFIYRRCKESIRAKCPIENERFYKPTEAGQAVIRDTPAVTTCAVGATVDITLARGYSPFAVGDKIGFGATASDAAGADAPTAVVVDVTSLPYMTVAALTPTTGLTATELAAGVFIVKK